jgi:hypothetical protein
MQQPLTTEDGTKTQEEVKQRGKFEYHLAQKSIAVKYKKSKEEHRLSRQKDGIMQCVATTALTYA